MFLSFVSFVTFFPWATPPCGPSAHHASRSGFWTCGRDFVEQFGGARVRGSAQCRVLSCSHRHQRTGQCDLAKMDGCSSSSETYGKKTSCILLRYCFGSYGCYSSDSSVSGYPWQIAIVLFANCTWVHRNGWRLRASELEEELAEAPVKGCSWGGKQMKKVGIIMVVNCCNPHKLWYEAPITMAIYLSTYNWNCTSKNHSCFLNPCFGVWNHHFPIQRSTFFPGRPSRKPTTAAFDIVPKQNPNVTVAKTPCMFTFQSFQDKLGVQLSKNRHFLSKKRFWEPVKLPFSHQTSRNHQAFSSS